MRKSIFRFYSRIQLPAQKTSYIPNFGVKDANEFKELLQKIIYETSEMLEDYKTKMPTTKLETCSKWFFKVKVFSEWSRLKLSVIIDSNINNEFEVFIKNGYETNGIFNVKKASGKVKIKAKGFTYVNYDKILKVFGVSCASLDKNERNSIANLVSESYTLKFYEKG